MECYSYTNNSKPMVMSVANINCCTLLCEISFHLCEWKKLACFFNMEENDIMELEYDYKKHHTRHETALKMLEKWILKKKMFNPPPNLGQLRDGLNSIGITLVVSPWKVHYNTDESRGLYS